MPIGNANIHIQNNVSEIINKLVSILFYEFNRVTSWKECKNILERSSSQIPKRITGIITKVTKVNVNMSFPNSNFERNFSTYVFGKSFW